MMRWEERAIEERALLNPSFCGVLLWHASAGYRAMTSGSPLPLELSFLVLPLVLHRETREALPKGVTTSLAVWLEENALTRARFPERARSLVPFTREALLLGGAHGMLLVSPSGVVEGGDWKKKISAELKAASDEVRSCAKRSEFVGRWFAAAGTPATVMALWGVRP